MISDTSPLIFLSKINKLSLLKELFGVVKITDAVRNEIIKEKRGFEEINRAIDEGWIKIFNAKDKGNYRLGKGESSVIDLARETKDPIIIDDKKAIKVLEGMDVDCVRTTSIIVFAYDVGIFKKDEAVKLINDLIDFGYYIAPRYYTFLLSKLVSEDNKEKR